MAKTCLIVDDSRTVRAFARAALEKLGFRTEEAADGSLALGICRRAMPEAILLDWHMPVMDGIEFLKQLRATQGGNQPIVLVCTTENDVAHIVEAIDAGANEYIMKPFDGDILASKLSFEGLI